MANYDVPENPEYSEEIRKIETSDPIHADVVNPIISQMLNNEAFLKNKLDVIATAICSTPQGTAVKAVDCPDFELRDGARVMVTFNNGNTSNYMKLNVNGTGEYFAYFPINGFRAYNNEAISKLIVAGCAYEFIFQDAEVAANRKWVYCGVVSTAESIGALSKNDLSNNSGGPGIPVIQSATDSGGLMEIGKYIDFHDAGSQTDFDARLYCENGELVSTVRVRADLDGNADSATKAMQDGNGNVIADTYLHLSGGDLTGNLEFKNRGQGIIFEHPGAGTAGKIYCNDGSDYDLTLECASGIYMDAPSIHATNSGWFGTGLTVSNKNLIYNDSNIGKLTMKQGTALVFDGNAGIRNFQMSSLVPKFSGAGAICAGYSDGCVMHYISGGYYHGHEFYSVSQDNKEIGVVLIDEGEIWCEKVYASGGDYAEYWEWVDSNPNSEDRVGLFVTFTGNKIRIAEKGDNLAKVGVISACPSIIGDSDKKEWKHKYQKDVYGRDIWQDVEQEDGTVIQDRILNPEYDETQPYIKRADRSEWDAVGTHGKLVVRDDGTCQPDGFCVPVDGGIATAADDGFYVMERLDESHIRIYMR